MYFHIDFATYKSNMVGREQEKEILNKVYQSNKSEFVAIIGRRRVGKTFLIREFFKGLLDFEMIGLKDGTKSQQLRNFAYSLKDVSASDELKVPQDWLEAFYYLKEYLEKEVSHQKKKVVFIDELPWIASAKSDFLTGFSFFWNSYASKTNIVVIVCGSATAWMIRKIINDKGGLHNRVTRKIIIQPFTLTETEAYFNARNIHFDRYQILQLYMTTGGIPHYLDQIEGGKSAIQNIDDVCFHPQGMLRTEFDNLYGSLFTHPERYENIVKILASTWKGLNRNEIVKATTMKDGGGLTSILQELEQSGFITSYVPFNKKRKATLYRLTDNYSLFYLKFIQPLATNQANSWQSLSQSQSWKSWSGYAFENICLQHIEKIKAALGIAGVHTQQYSFFAKATETVKGTQIDLLIDRQDNVINLCEIKFYNDEFSISKSYAENLQHKKRIFKRLSKTKKQIFITLITTYGLSPNKHSLGLVDNVLALKHFF